MKSFVSAAALGLFAVASPALAADVPAEQQYQAAQVSYYEWTGAYFGIHGGYAAGTVETSSDTLPAAFETEYDLDFALAGVQFGYNHQLGSNFVVGFEVDASFTDAEESEDPVIPGITEFQSDLDWLATARVRVGYAFDNLLVFATAGGAAAETDDSVGLGTGGELEERRSRKGWTAGAGAEWAFSENWTAKADYLYVDLGEETVSENGLNVFPGGDAGGDTLEFEHTYHLGRVGVNYRF